jgi:hypothetical protein
MSKNQEFFTVYCTRESGETRRVQEWTYANAVEHACKLVDREAKQNADGARKAVKIEIEQNFVESQRKPRPKFGESVPLDSSKSTCKLFRLRRKLRKSDGQAVEQPEEKPVARVRRVKAAAPIPPA